ncbi:Efflux RND transporter periplasmic adaptor subunit [Sulfidibacter corallicola]|uniref:Efflux RND transporter periplasmic adaptor subunit n=1 Tax=Sulfidibacter corallicola TaxID=2818388 RepID=A0A8A4TMV9_SULCO|nr:efflux RND transporter periplasmic adaptor subunit [Sulfidibacter corallicola]QTD51306.1 efflux RND transporter periplasmic adaptor subunit [Sulfidibacter corallicola]
MQKNIDKPMPDGLRSLVRSALSFLVLIAGITVAAGDTEPRIERGPFHQELVLSGTLAAENSERFYAPRTQQWNVTIQWMKPEGETAAPGEAIVRFDDSGMVDKIEQLEKDLEEQEKKHQNLIAEMRDQKLDLDRQIEEAELDMAIANVDAAVPEDLRKAREYHDFQLALAKSRTDLERKRFNAEQEQANARDKIKGSALNLELLKTKLAHARQLRQSLELKTTRGGVVIYEEKMGENRKLQPGDSVQSTRPVVNIPDLSRLQLEVYVTEFERRQIEEGQRVAARLDAYPDIELTGQVRSVSKQAIQKRTWGKSIHFKVVVALDRMDPDRMRPGMSARTAIQLVKVDSALLVPMTAVQWNASGYWIQARDREPLLVHPLGFDDFYMAIDDGSGLSEGTLLVARFSPPTTPAKLTAGVPDE